MKIVDKGWGWEKWIDNKPEYCGKMLVFNEGKKCSWHYHKLKDETLYLQSGCLQLKYSPNDDIEKCKNTVLNPGDSFYIYPGLRHQMIAILDSELIEFSTQHFDEDSYRIIKGD